MASPPKRAEGLVVRRLRVIAGTRRTDPKRVRWELRAAVGTIPQVECHGRVTISTDAAPGTDRLPSGEFVSAHLHGLQRRRPRNRAVGGAVTRDPPAATRLRLDAHHHAARVSRVHTCGLGALMSHLESEPADACAGGAPAYSNAQPGDVQKGTANATHNPPMIGVLAGPYETNHAHVPR